MWQIIISQNANNEGGFHSQALLQCDSALLLKERSLYRHLHSLEFGKTLDLL